jgi:hypothetical protein
MILEYEYGMIHLLSGVSHVYPIHEEEHTLTLKCQCHPSLVYSDGEYLCWHNAYDASDLVLWEPTDFQI